VTATTELSCRELIELVTEYLEGALPAADVARFEEHVSSCSGCRAYVEQMRRVIELTGRLTPDAVSPHAERALLDAFRDWKQVRI
jgi:predicted anti-sigma-YlaC factor YlaD